MVVVELLLVVVRYRVSAAAVEDPNGRFVVGAEVVDGIVFVPRHPIPGLEEVKSASIGPNRFCAVWAVPPTVTVGRRVARTARSTQPMFPRSGAAMGRPLRPMYSSDPSNCVSVGHCVPRSPPLCPDTTARRQAAVAAAFIVRLAGDIR